MKKAYFEDYCGNGPYRDCYLDHSGIEHCISICRKLKVPVASVAVLGTATGEILDHFWRAWRVRPVGCELSYWAHGEIPKRFRRHIDRADLRRWLPQRVAAGEHFDLVFSNALVYLNADVLPAVVRDMARVGGHFHFWSSTAEDFEPDDAERRTLEPLDWWRALFVENGFEPTRSKYLWRSRLGGSA